MKVLVVGASAGTGRAVVEQGLAKSWTMIALSRSGCDVPGAEQVLGDAREEAVVSQAIAGGVDAVVLAIGGTRGRATNRADVTRTVLRAVAGSKTRVVVHSSLGVGDSRAFLPAASRWFVLAILAKALADHEEQEKLVRSSGLPWTIVRPGGLTDDAPSGRLVALEEPGPMGGTVARADVAGFIIDCLNRPETIGKTFALGTAKA